MHQNRHLFFDYLRVLSVFFVITSHYAYMFDNSELVVFPREYLTASIGRLGVSFFFIISGAIAWLSLSKHLLKTYYIRRFFSILVPYNVAYIVMALLLLVVWFFFNLSYPRNPLVMLMKEHRPLIDIVPSLVGFDHYLHGVYDIDTMYFTGEWFIGCIIVLYLLAPLVYKGVCRYPLAALIVGIAISCLFYDRSFTNPYWSAPVRLSDFVLGMVFMKEHMRLQRNINLIAVVSLLILMFIFLISISTDGSIREVFFPLAPQSLFFAMLFLLLFFYIYLKYMLHRSENISSTISNVASRAYIIMLIQHVVIIFISANIDFSELTTGYAILFYLLILVTIDLLSRGIKVISARMERYFLKKCL